MLNWRFIAYHSFCVSWGMRDLPENREATMPMEREAPERQIAATDDQIDTLVYELYGLTDAEIKIVEEATRER